MRNRRGSGSTPNAPASGREHTVFNTKMLRIDITRIIRLALVFLLIAQTTGCGSFGEDGRDSAYVAPATTYRKFLARAEAGDAESQNVVGFMLFHGEGVRMDRARAQEWFQRSAEQGNPRARRNLANMNSLVMPAPGGATAREVPFGVSPPLPAGQTRYEKFCAGCHGFNGISAYVHSPSFALGESLHKGDADLLQSLQLGKGEMPNWDDKFSFAELVDVLQFVRTLPTRYQQGIGQSLRGAPPLFYLFGPMKPDQPAYRERLLDYGFDTPKTEK